MKTKQTVIAVAMATSAALLVAGCSSSGTPASSGKSVDFGAKLSGTMTTSGFTLGDEVATSRADLATAKLKSSGVTVTINQSNFDPQKFAAQAASGQLPDLVQMDRQYVATYASKGLIMPLDKCFTAQNVDAAKHYYPALLKDVTYKGAIYGIPQFLQPQGILVNKRVADAAGVTAADLNTSKPDTILAAAAKMYKADASGKPTTLGFDAQLPGQVGMWFLAFGGKMMDSTGKPTLNDPANVKALTFLKKLYDEQGGYNKAYSFGQTWDFFGAKNQFVSDQVGAGFYAQWYPNVLANYSSKIDITGVPIMDPSGKPIAAAGGGAYVIPTKAKNPAAACAWALADTSDAAWIAATKARLKTVASKPGALFTGIFTGSATADKIIHDQYIKPTGNAGFDAVIQMYYSEMANVVSVGSSSAGLQIQTELQNAVVPALTGKKTVQEALDGAQAAAMLAYTP